MIALFSQMAVGTTLGVALREYERRHPLTRLQYRVTTGLAFTLLLLQHLT